jgi:hypothetical protein
MSDGLVKDLHTTNLFDADGWESGLGKEAADEITRLRAENGRLEAKLAKAVAILRDAERLCAEGHPVSALNLALAVLAELKRETDA